MCRDTVEASFSCSAHDKSGVRNKDAVRVPYRVQDETLDTVPAAMSQVAVVCPVLYFKLGRWWEMSCGLHFQRCEILV